MSWYLLFCLFLPSWNRNLYFSCFIICNNNSWCSYITTPVLISEHLFCVSLDFCLDKYPNNPGLGRTLCPTSFRVNRLRNRLSKNCTRICFQYLKILSSEWKKWSCFSAEKLECCWGSFGVWGRVSVEPRHEVAHSSNHSTLSIFVPLVCPAQFDTNAELVMSAERIDTY